MNEVMRREIESQPDVLRHSLPDLRSQAASLSGLRGVGRLVLTGSGDSFFAPLALQAAAQRLLPPPVHVLPSMQAAHYLHFGADDLLVAISISGETRYTVAAAEAARRAGAGVLAVTASRGSSLAQMATKQLVLPIRSESRQTPHAVDYMSTLLALAVALEHLADEPLPFLAQLPATVQEVLERLEEPCFALGKRHAGCRHFFFLGSGANRATAHYGAAKFWEAGGAAAHGLDLEEFAHGAHLMLAPDDLVLLIAADDPGLVRVRTMAAGLRAVGAHGVVIAQGEAALDLPRLRVPGLPQAWSPLVTCLPLQWLCLAVANERQYDVLTKNGLGAEADAYQLIQRA